MRKYMVILICLLTIFSFLSGCGNKQNTNTDSREKEIVQLVVNEKYEEALVRAKELYKGEDKELKETLDWINKYINNAKDKQKRIQDLYPSSKLEIQSGHTYKIRGYYSYINGQVKNISDKDIHYFEVVAKYLDSNGQVLDSDYTNDGLKLSPGEQRSFEIMHKWDEKYDKYNLSIGKVK